MSEPNQATSRVLNCILHPTDLTTSSKRAFVHGLKLALAAKGHFYVVQAEEERAPDDANWAGFPGVRNALARWGLLEAGASSAWSRTSLACVL